MLAKNAKDTRQDIPECPSPQSPGGWVLISALSSLVSRAEGKLLSVDTVLSNLGFEMGWDQPIAV